MQFVKSVLRLGFVAAAFLLLLPAAAHAQSAIAGSAKDTTGAVMPGVTVEASSPALIEGTRSVVTDGSGLYKIVDLRPGTYSVTFTLTGFNVVKREGIEIPDNFTATINAEMKVGSIEESVTVSGQSPVVDLQSPAAQQVLPRSVVDAVPTGRSLWSVGSLVPSVTLSGVDVGGSRGMQQLTIAVHGSDSKDTAVEVDGMLLNSFEDGVQQYYNDMMFEEFNYQTSAITAETQAAGVRLNMIPKEGGNAFKGTVFYSNEPGAWVGNNLTGALKFDPVANPLGLKAANPTKVGTDLSGAFGGPIAKDKLWFFTSGRRWGVDTYESNSFYNADPTRKSFDPNFSQQVVDDNLIKSGMLRLTYRAGPHKFAAYLDRIIKFRGHEGAVGNMEETYTIRTPRIYYTSEVKYTGTWTNKLLFETGISVNQETYSTGQPQSEVLPTDIGRTEGTGFTELNGAIVPAGTAGSFLVGSGSSWGAPVGVYNFRWPNREGYLNSSLSYVTGSHAFKAGLVIGRGHEATTNTINDNMIQKYTAGVASGVTVWNTPVSTDNWAQYDAGIYAQDTWTFKRVTLNPGIRFDMFNSYFPAVNEVACVFCQTPTTPAGTTQPARSFAAEATSQQPHWKDTDPRLGMVWDVFGDNKTALKASWGRYVSTYHGGFSSVYNPSAVVTDSRNWSDLNHDDIAEYGPLGSCGNPTLYCEIGASSNTAFGTTAARDHTAGIKRPYNYETAVSVQRQVMPGMAVTFGYTHRTYHNIYFEQNLTTQPLGTALGTGYTAFVVPDPIDATKTLTIYNQNPALITPNFLDQISPTDTRTYTAFDLQFNSRVFGGTIFGGASWGKQSVKTCDGIDPNAAGTGIAGPTGSNGFCDQTAIPMPYRGQYKLSGSYPLPLGIAASATFQAYPGGSSTQSGGDSSLNETYSINSTLFKQLTGATLTGGTLSIRLLQPGQVFLPYVKTLDARLSKSIKFFSTRKLALNFDVFNIMNANPITGYGRVFGSAFNQISSTITGRVISVGGRLDF